MTTEADATTMAELTTEEVIEPTSQYDDRYVKELKIETVSFEIVCSEIYY